MYFIIHMKITPLLKIVYFCRSLS